MSYLKRREEIYRPLRDNGIFNWDYMYNSEYALASIYAVSQENKAELAYAAERLGKIFTKAIEIVQIADRQLFLELGIPELTIAAARRVVIPEIPTLIGRFDFTKTNQGWKMLEFNSDTPGGIVEAYYANGKVCDYYGLCDPNKGLESEITNAFQTIIKRYASLGYDTHKIVFSALDWHAEDAGTARYLMNCAKVNACFAPLKNLRLYKDKLWVLMDNALEPIDVLYRLHPLGLLSGEKDTDDFPTGAFVLKLIEEGKLAIINPPSAIIAQTKALQVLIWNLHEMQEFFTEEEHEIIDTYMLPTYMENRFLTKCPYVTKPVLGREGNGIGLYNEDGVLTENTSNHFVDQGSIYQKKVDLEVAEVETLKGVYRGYLLWGAFLLNGKASAIDLRIGGRITDDMAYFLPIHLK
ncbi:MAG: glutathionylspermidine synthase [Massilibacillus sp.]|jgi:glutathionylspermidine synthase|nr:glutathionylspermidine synthase [Massilibacillus sp.]